MPDGGTVNGDWLGSACKADSDCVTASNGKAETAKCAVAEKDDPVFGGGPAEGYCTQTCQKSGDCPGTGSICLKPQGATEGRCLLGCEIGPPLNSLFDPLDDTKCHGRENVRCQRLTAGDVCVPTCGNDAECGAGRACDLGAGVCVAMATVGKPLGAECDPMAAQEECSTGLCVGGLSNGKGFCSGFCTLGGSTSYGECGGTDKGLCLITPAVQNCPADQLCSGAGDYGFCSNNCDSHDDCPNPDLWCRTILGAGRCFFTLECTMNGQPDCSKLMGTTCTDVGGGKKFCLEPKYPLNGNNPDGGAGGAGPADGGGAGGGGVGGSPADAGPDGG
jgi:hypothetical protein